MKVSRTGTITYEEGGAKLVAQIENDTIREVALYITGAGRQPDSLKLTASEAQTVQALLLSVFPLPPETTDA